MHSHLTRAVFLIALGCVFLAHNFGLIPNLGQLMAQWWPLILVAVGIASLFRPQLHDKHANKDVNHE